MATLHHRHTDGDCTCGEVWPCERHAPRCGSCGSHDPRYTDWLVYRRIGRDCVDAFHRDADL